jgi:hypothetical protein
LSDDTPRNKGFVSATSPSTLNLTSLIADDTMPISQVAIDAPLPPALLHQRYNQRLRGIITRIKTAPPRESRITTEWAKDLSKKTVEEHATRIADRTVDNVKLLLGAERLPIVEQIRSLTPVTDNDRCLGN